MGTTVMPAKKKRALKNNSRATLDELGITLEAAGTEYLRALADFNGHLVENSIEQDDGSFFIPVPLRSLLDRWDRLTGAMSMIWVCVCPDREQWELVERSNGSVLELRNGPIRDLHSLCMAVIDFQPIQHFKGGMRVEKASMKFLGRSIELLMTTLAECVSVEEMGKLAGLADAANQEREGALQTRNQINTRPTDLITLQDAERQFNRTRSTFLKWINAGKLRSFRDDQAGPHLVSLSELRRIPGLSEESGPPHR